MKVYRIKKSHVLEIENTNQSNLELAYVKGYVFVKVEEQYYALNTNKSRSRLIMQLVELEIKED